MSGEALIIWTVYENPSDIPGSFAARKHVVVNGKSYPTNEVIVTDTLDAIRENMIDRGLTCIIRSPEDEPQIVESWL